MARQVLRHLGFGEIVGYVSRVQKIEAGCEPLEVTREQVEAQITRCRTPRRRSA